jgi:hypothetical protein
MANLRQRLRYNRVVIVDPSGMGDFKTIAAACTHISSKTHDATNQWLIVAYTNDFDPETFTLPTFTTIMYEGAKDVDGDATGMSVVTNEMLAGKFKSATGKAGFFGRYGSGTANTLEIDRQADGTVNIGGDLLNINDHPATSGTVTGNLIKVASSGGGVSSGDKFVVERDGSVKLTGGLYLKIGAGTPEGAVTAPVGSLFLRTNGGAGTCLYVKETGTGNTGWVAK